MTGNMTQRSCLGDEEEDGGGGGGGNSHSNYKLFVTSLGGLSRITQGFFSHKCS